jgi:hypothetical protein
MFAMSEMRKSIVHVETTSTDYAAAQRVLGRGAHAPWRTLLWITPALVVLIVAWLGMTAIVEEVVPRSAGLGALVTLPIAWIIYFRLVRYTNKYRYKSILDPNGSFLTPTDIELAPDGVHWSSKRGEGRTNWSAVHKIEETKQHIYIFVDRAAAHVLPKRNFATPEAATAFVKLALQYFSASRAPTSA